MIRLPKVFLLFILLLLHFGFSEAFALDKNLITKVVLNGKPVAPKSAAWSHSVLIQALKSDGSVLSTCSGTLVTTDSILTAAHCLDYAYSFKVYMGVTKTSEGFDYVLERIPLAFSSVYQPKKGPVPVSEKNGFLDSNTQKKLDFQKYVQALSDFEIKTLDDYLGIDNFALKDLAILFVQEIDSNEFTPATILSDSEPEFKDYVYNFGFGIESRDLKNNSYELRESKTKLYSYVGTHGLKKWIFFKSYSEQDEALCFGDSGSGSYFFNPKTKQLELAGIFVGTENNCSGASWHLILTEEQLEWIIREIKKFKKTISI